MTFIGKHGKFTRFRFFKNPETFKQKLLEKLPKRIDLGAVYDLPEETSSSSSSSSDDDDSSSSESELDSDDTESTSGTDSDTGSDNEDEEDSDVDEIAEDRSNGDSIFFYFFEKTNYLENE